MTQQMPPYLDKSYPPQASVHETKNAAHYVQRRCNEHLWNETEEKFHYLYVDIDKYETAERSKCVARFVGKFPNGAGGVHYLYRTRILVG